MALDYYFQQSDTQEELTVQTVFDCLSIRVTEDDGSSTALLLLPEEEIDKLIRGLEDAKKKIAEYRTRLNNRILEGIRYAPIR